MGLNKTNLQLRKGYAGKITAGAIAFSIILILFISGPANAFVLNINSDKTSVETGETVEFTLNVDISSSDETLPVENITLTLDGPVKRECVFDANGNILSGCAGIISIQRTDNTVFGYGYGSYGYGYGYSNGKLEYKLKLGTANYPKGIYHTKLTVLTNSYESSKNGNDLEIKPKKELSVVSRSSSPIKEEKIISKNKIYISKGDVYSFSFDERDNEILINDIIDSSVNLTVKPNEKNVIVKISEPAEIDINKDGEYDMEIKAWYIGDDLASIYIKSDSIKDLNEKEISLTSADKHPEYFKAEIEQSSKSFIGIYEILALALANLIVFMLILIAATIKKIKQVR